MDIVTVSCLRELDFHDNRSTCLKVSKLVKQLRVNDETVKCSSFEGENRDFTAAWLDLELLDWSW